MIDYQILYQTLSDHGADVWADILPEQLQAAFNPARHGQLTRWLQAIDDYPELSPSQRVFNEDTVKIGTDSDLADISPEDLTA